MNKGKQITKGMAKYASLIIGGILLLAVVATGSFTLGYGVGTEFPKSVIIKGITNIDDPDATADFSIFWEALKELRDTHLYSGKVSDQDLVYGAVSGLVSAFGDPNTTFFKPEDSQKFEEDIKGQFGGIGAEIGIREEQLVIVAPLKGSPAEHAGLESGDYIMAINKESTRGISVNDAVKKIRGPIGEPVTLTIVHKDGGGVAEDINVVRDVIRVPTIEVTRLENNIAHIKIFSFNENAPFAFYNEAAKLLFDGTQGIILDLRNNPGGFLEVSVNLAGWFLDRGTVVVKERFREEQSDRNKEFKTNGSGALKRLPVVVLMNGGSASASEILAGALRDNRKTKIIGEQSFGKGTVQELHPLVDDGSQLKITVAEWILPNGGTIEKEGLTPDVKVELTREDVEAGNDPQLEKAIEVLRGEVSAIVKK